MERDKDKPRQQQTSGEKQLLKTPIVEDYSQLRLKIRSCNTKHRDVFVF